MAVKKTVAKAAKPAVETKNAETPILERYIHTIFRKQAIEFNSEQEDNKALKYFYSAFFS